MIGTNGHTAGKDHASSLELGVNSQSARTDWNPGNRTKCCTDIGLHRSVVHVHADVRGHQKSSGTLPTRARLRTQGSSTRTWPQGFPGAAPPGPPRWRRLCLRHARRSGGSCCTLHASLVSRILFTISSALSCMGPAATALRATPSWGRHHLVLQHQLRTGQVPRTTV